MGTLLANRPQHDICNHVGPYLIRGWYGATRVTFRMIVGLLPQLNSVS